MRPRGWLLSQPGRTLLGKHLPAAHPIPAMFAQAARALFVFRRITSKVDGLSASREQTESGQGSQPPSSLF